MKENKETIWFYCEDCKRYFKGKEAIKECLSFGHKLKRRTPISERMKFKTQGLINIPLNIDVNKQTWRVFLHLLIFRDPRKYNYESLDTRLLPNWQWCGGAVLNYDWKTLSKKLSWLRPQVSVKELTDMVSRSIKQDNYKETDTPFLIQMFVCHDSDLKLIPLNEKSKWIITTMSELKSSVSGQGKKWLNRVLKYTNVMKP